MPPPVAEYGTRVPFFVLTLAERERQEETARAPSGGPAQNCAPGPQLRAERAARAKEKWLTRGKSSEWRAGLRFSDPLPRSDRLS